jgi:hypothetical protein
MDKYIVSQVKDTIDMFSNRLPDYYETNSSQNYVSIYWNVDLNQDSLWDMFESKRNMETYFNDIKYFFETDYPEYELGIKIDIVPICIQSDLYGRVILYYYIKDNHHNTNIFLTV